MGTPLTTGSDRFATKKPICCPGLKEKVPEVQALGRALLGQGQISKRLVLTSTRGGLPRKILRGGAGGKAEATTRNSTPFTPRPPENGTVDRARTDGLQNDCHFCHPGHLHPLTRRGAAHMLHGSTRGPLHLFTVLGMFSGNQRLPLAPAGALADGPNYRERFSRPKKKRGGQHYFANHCLKLRVQRGPKCNLHSEPDALSSDISHARPPGSIEHSTHQSARRIDPDGRCDEAFCRVGLEDRCLPFAREERDCHRPWL